MLQRSVGLDVLRAVCVVGVLATHFSQFFFTSSGAGGSIRQTLALGSFGVTGFFLLSAYLLTRILLKEAGTGQSQVWKRYWIRRSLRIWPLYYLAIVVFVVVAVATSKPIPGLRWLVTFTYNWTGWYAPNAVLSHFWSMCVEEQLYVLIPILCFIGFKWRVRLLAVLIVAAPVSRWLVAQYFPYPAVWNFTTSHLDVFAIGVLLASLDHANGRSWLRVREAIGKSRWIAAVVGALVLLLVVASTVNAQWVFASGASSWTYLLAALVWAWSMVKLTRKPLTQDKRAMRSAVWVGQRSYGIYVYHLPAVMLGVLLSSILNVPPPVVGVVLIAVVLIISEASFRWVESPFLRLKARFSRELAPVS